MGSSDAAPSSSERKRPAPVILVEDDPPTAPPGMQINVTPADGSRQHRSQSQPDTANALGFGFHIQVLPPTPNAASNRDRSPQLFKFADSDDSDDDQTGAGADRSRGQRYADGSAASILSEDLVGTDKGPAQDGSDPPAMQRADSDFDLSASRNSDRIQVEMQTFSEKMNVIADHRVADPQQSPVAAGQVSNVGLAGPQAAAGFHSIQQSFREMSMDDVRR